MRVAVLRFVFFLSLAAVLLGASGSGSPLFFNEIGKQGETGYLAGLRNLSIHPGGDGLTIGVRPRRRMDAGRRDGWNGEAGHERFQASQGAESRVSIGFVGTSPNAESRGSGRDRAKIHYLRGEGKSWEADLSRFSRVRFSEVYEGIDVEYYGDLSGVEYDFVVAPGADPDQILLSLSGFDSSLIDDSGDLVLTVGGEQFVHRRPAAYHEIEGERELVEAGYERLNGDENGQGRNLRLGGGTSRNGPIQRVRLYRYR